MKEEKCSQCGRRLTENNCTCITTICDDCLADQAAEDRTIEWENCPTWE